MKSYLEFNREERFYCALSSHVLLSSEYSRIKFAELIKRKFDISLSTDKLEVYVEVAALRDHWNDLGDPKKYSQDTHQKRLQTLNAIFDTYEIPRNIIEQLNIFWTNGTPRKLWNPSHWNLKNLDNPYLEKLKVIKWAFNAKPDILIKSGENALLIEAKFESKEGRSGSSGYEQFMVQEHVAKLMKLLIPYFKAIIFFNLVLSLDDKKGISWRELVATISETEIDRFTLEAFKKFN